MDPYRSLLPKKSATLALACKVNEMGSLGLKVNLSPVKESTNNENNSPLIRSTRISVASWWIRAYNLIISGELLLNKELPRDIRARGGRVENQIQVAPQQGTANICSVERPGQLRPS